MSNKTARSSYNNASSTMLFLDGHPVPYSLTVQHPNGESVSNAYNYLPQVRGWLALHRPGQHIERIEGAYVFYSQGIRLSLFCTGKAKRL